MKEAYRARHRKLVAKRDNERIKLLSSAINTLAMAFIISAFVFPIVRSGNLAAFSNFFTWFWLVFGVTIHLNAQYFLGFLKSEE